MTFYTDAVTTSKIRHASDDVEFLMTKYIRQRIQSFRDLLGERKVGILNALAMASDSFPAGVKAARFRADNPGWMSELDELVAVNTLIERSHDQEDIYRLKPYALPLLCVQRAKDIIEVMENLLPYLQSIYRERLNQKVLVDELYELNIAGRDLLRDVLYMMEQCHAFFGGRSGDFPDAPGAHVYLRESVLSLDSCLEELTRYYDKQPVDRSAMSAIATLSNFEYGERIELPSILGACDAAVSEMQCLEFLDDQERAMLLEVDKALRAGLCALSVMGIRALFDLFVHKHVPDHGSFSRSLDALQKHGYLSARQGALIAPVFELGSATMHRGYYPSAQDVSTCVAVYAHIIRYERSLSSEVGRLRERIPPRGKN